MGWYDSKRRRIRDLSCGDTRVVLEVHVRRIACRTCGLVKRERLDWLSENPFYAERFAFYVGRRCVQGTLQAVAKELNLDWHTVQGAGEAVHAGPA